MKLFPVLCAIAVLLAEVCPVHAQTPADAPPRPKIEDAVPIPKKEVVVEPRAGDQQIARRLRDILIATDWFITPVVNVREGVVFLDGEVREEIHRKWASDLAQSTQDVVAVVNRIQIRREVIWDFDAARREVNLLYWQIARSLPLLLLAAFILLISWVLTIGVATLARHLLKQRNCSPLTAR